MSWSGPRESAAAPRDRVLSRVEACYDAAPRPTATTEEVGPFTLFRADDRCDWPFYARPRLGLDAEVTPGDVRRVVARQRELGLPPSLEWVHEVTPTLLPAVRAALVLEDAQADLELCPLLVLPADAPPAGPHPMPSGERRTTFHTRLLDADDPDLPRAVGTVSAAFAGHDDATPADPGVRTELIRAGHLLLAAAYDEDGTLVGAGTAGPRGDAAELTGIAVLPRARRRGAGSALTATLAAACRAAGATTVFLSAASDDAAAVYRREGFERRGTAAILGLR